MATRAQGEGGDDTEVFDEEESWRAANRSMYISGSWRRSPGRAGK
jgi:hypothetical protein